MGAVTQLQTAALIKIKITERSSGGLIHQAQRSQKSFRFLHPIGGNSQFTYEELVSVSVEDRVGMRVHLIK